MGALITLLTLTLSLKETKAENNCCESMYIQDLATGCFTRNNCPKLQWLGKNACLSIVVNAIDNKNLQNTISNYNAEYFKLKKLSEDSRIEMLRDEKNNI